MPDCRDRRIVLEIRVGKDGAFREKLLEALGEFRLKPREVIEAKLIDRDEQDEANGRTVRRLCCRQHGDGRQDRKNEDENSLHYSILFQPRCSFA